MNTYVYAEATIEDWPIIKSFQARSYNDAVEIVMGEYFKSLDDDELINFDYFEDFRDYLNETYSIALSDIEVLEEL